MVKRRQADTSPPEYSGESVLPLNTVFTVLANEQRRTILSYLTRCRYPVPFEELVEIVASQETESNSVETSDEVYERVAMGLYHTQLPKLADWGVIDYDENLRLIQPADTLRPLDEHLRLSEQHDSEWQNWEYPPS